MASEDRELRAALESAQAALKTARAELELTRNQRSQFAQLERELEATRRELAEAQVRGRALADALEQAKREKGKPRRAEPVVPPRPVSPPEREPEFRGAGAPVQAMPQADKPGAPPPRRRNPVPGADAETRERVRRAAAESLLGGAGPIFGGAAAGSRHSRPRIASPPQPRVTVPNFNVSNIPAESEEPTPSGCALVFVAAGAIAAAMGRLAWTW